MTRTSPPRSEQLIQDARRKLRWRLVCWAAAGFLWGFAAGAVVVALLTW